MKVSEDIEERIAIIAESMQLSQADAQKIYEQSKHISIGHYDEKLRHIRELATLQRMGKHHMVSSKKAAGND